MRLRPRSHSPLDRYCSARRVTVGAGRTAPSNAERCAIARDAHQNASEAGELLAPTVVGRVRATRSRSAALLPLRCVAVPLRGGRGQTPDEGAGGRAAPGAVDAGSAAPAGPVARAPQATCSTPTCGGGPAAQRVDIDRLQVGRHPARRGWPRAQLRRDPLRASSTSVRANRPQRRTPLDARRGRTLDGQSAWGIHPLEIEEGCAWRTVLPRPAAPGDERSALRRTVRRLGPPKLAPTRADAPCPKQPFLHARALHSTLARNA